MWLVLMIASCSDQNPAQTQLEQNQKKWTNQKIGSYSYQLQIGCFCPQDITRAVTITVKNAYRVFYTDDSTAADNEFILRCDTVEKLFKTIGDAINGKAAEITVSYDPARGYPLRIFVDSIKLAIDDEITYNITAFQILK
jgi:hypothetical protein